MLSKEQASAAMRALELVFGVIFHLQMRGLVERETAANLRCDIETGRARGA